jgi:anti-sigma B factor antagonist
MGLGVSPGGEPHGKPPHVRTETARSDPFGIRVEEKGSTLLLHLSGEFDWACIGRVEAALERVSESRVKRVILDLEKLQFMDSAGLRTILRANDRASAERFELVVVRPRGLANRVFTLTRASKQLPLVDAP